ncbi:ester cyclase [Haloarcula litorea]|uniref:ester cyclase n=1 Tax=Haloarcula litorea TaxID=3032579 RepID=UPI0023E78E6E|nr:ester cyclase [Halomicroarcula sp. GDY20]
MPTSSIDEYYDRYVEGWNNHDSEGVIDAFADGGTVSDPATEGTLSGEEIKEWVEETTEGFPDVRFEVERRVADHDKGLLFVEWTMYGTHDGPFGPLPPTGQSVEMNGVDVIAFSDDGITSINGFFDMTDFKEQLGLTFPAVLGQLPTLAVGAIKATL